MQKQAFTKIWIFVVVIVLIAGGILAWQYFGVPKEKITQTETKWKAYALEKITQDFQSPNFMDRRLVGIRDSGQQDVLISSVKELMGWERLPGEAGFYPVKVSFPSYSNKIFFTKYIAGTGHSAGFFMLDVSTLEFRQLTNAGPIYENYYNYLSIISPDGFRIASLGGEELYLLDLLNDKVELLTKAESGEVFYPAKEIPNFIWRDNDAIQYPVYSTERIYDPPIEIRQISTKTKKVEKVGQDETANWKTYIDDENGYEVKHPANWRMEVYEKTHEMAIVEGSVMWYPPWVPSEKIDVVIEINIAKKQEGYSISMMLFGKDITCENVEIGDLTFCKLIKKSEKANVLDIISYSVSKNNKIYTIGILYELPESEMQREFNVFNQMLSTFRFLE